MCISRTLTASCRWRRSFPTRRSSDLDLQETMTMEEVVARENLNAAYRRVVANKGSPGVDGMKVNELGDRKSTRLNSSHVAISYAVFCLKQKTIAVSAHEPTGGTYHLY